MNGPKYRFKAGYLFFLAMFAAMPAFAGQGPFNYFLYSHGPVAKPVMVLGWAFTATVVAVFIIVAVLLVWAVLRKREAKVPASIGHEDQGMRWIYIGTGITACILFAMAIYMLITLNAVARPAREPALTLTVTGYDWWWKVEYEDSNPGRRFVTANEIHIPVGQPVLVKLKSADVIHAFWVPMLAGKTQAIPGLTNQQWIQADAAGVYLGECTQFCGVQHAHMGLEVVAQTEDEFRAWQDAQRKTTAAVSSVNVDAGRKLFMDQCAGCHAVRGTEAVGAHGPDLTHLNSRRLIAAGLLVNTPDHLMHWITQAQQIKPGARMPSMVLTGP
ncbi:MAG: cytochrome c oxidase subunit II, partial [Methylobacter sp.]